MEIKQQFISKNFTINGMGKIEHLVIHDTANTNVGADAQAHYNYFNTTDRKVSTHFVIDDKEVLQLVKMNDMAWHIGTGKNGISNSNSLGIEMCINSDSNCVKMYNNTVELVRELKVVFPNIRVIRHFDASSYNKMCPQHMSFNNWERWYKFMQDIEYEVPKWKIDEIQKLLDLGILNDEDWLNKAEEPAQVWFVCALINRIYKLTD